MPLLVPTPVGRTQAVDASRTMEGMGFMPTFIWASNTERSYETAAIIARESNLGQNRYITTTTTIITTTATTATAFWL